VKIPKGYWIGQTEVTNAAFRRFLTARGKTGSVAEGDQFPKGGISWLDAVDFCAWAGGRLPSEKEWEYAARGGVRGARYVTGDRLDEQQVTLGNAPRPVASHSPNGFGLYDVSGNVAEWTDDDPTYFRYDAEPRSRPPTEPRNFVLVRGGSYASVSRELQLDFGTSAEFNAQDPTIGFRCLIDGTDLDLVANSYRINPFAAMYEGYMMQTNPYARAFYQSWWIRSTCASSTSKSSTSNSDARLPQPAASSGPRALHSGRAGARAARHRIDVAVSILVDESIYLRWAEIIDHQGQWFVSLLDAKQPLSYWLYALARKGFPDADPLLGARSVSVAAGGVATALLFQLGRQLGGTLAALAAAFFYALVPYGVFYDRLRTSMRW
jgi:hypothetical protein